MKDEIINGGFVWRDSLEKYHLLVIGSSCFYNVPLNRRGHLSVFIGKLIRLLFVHTGQYDRGCIAGIYLLLIMNLSDKIVLMIG